MNGVWIERHNNNKKEETKRSCVKLENCKSKSYNCIVEIIMFWSFFICVCCKQDWYEKVQTVIIILFWGFVIDGYSTTLILVPLSFFYLWGFLLAHINMNKNDLW
jgi:hypothetical protein